MDVTMEWWYLTVVGAKLEVNLYMWQCSIDCLGSYLQKKLHLLSLRYCGRRSCYVVFSTTYRTLSYLQDPTSKARSTCDMRHATFQLWWTPRFQLGAPMARKRDLRLGN